MLPSLKQLFLRTNGLISIKPKIRITDNYTLSLVYSPGVGFICQTIKENPDSLYDLTITGNSIALLTDGSSNYSPNKEPNQKRHHG